MSMKKKRAIWDGNKDFFIISLLSKAALDGQRSDNGFKKTILCQVAVDFNAKFGVSPAIDFSQIQTRMHSV